MYPKHQKYDSQSASAQVDERMEAITKSCTQYAADCIEKLLRIFLRKHMDDANYASFAQEVAALYQAAGRLSLELWVQRPLVQCKFLSQLSRSRFDSMNVALKAHPLHKHDDREDHSLDGRPIKVVMHPAVFAAGTHEGERYGEEQCWAPAILWLDVVSRPT
jgi:hypothetical protein